MDAMKLQKKGRRKGNREVCTLPEEIDWEILVLLPVKSFIRFQTVCKAWQATISDPAFILAQLRCSASKCEQDPTFIISPNILNTEIPAELRPCINHLRFYQWKEGASMAEFMHDKAFDREFTTVRQLAHCDGLVLVPTDTKLYVFNPATRDAITLPDSNRNNQQRSGEDTCLLG